MASLTLRGRHIPGVWAVLGGLHHFCDPRSTLPGQGMAPTAGRHGLSPGNDEPAYACQLAHCHGGGVDT